MMQKKTFSEHYEFLYTFSFRLSQTIIQLLPYNNLINQLEVANIGQQFRNTATRTELMRHVKLLKQTVGIMNQLIDDRALAFMPYRISEERL